MLRGEMDGPEPGSWLALNDIVVLKGDPGRLTEIEFPSTVRWRTDTPVTVWSLPRQRRSPRIPCPPAASCCLPPGDLNHTPFAP